MKFSVMITTRDRRSDLRRTCVRISSLHPPPEEVLICADGCSDGTAAMVREEFPGFTLLENKVVLGSVASRDRLLRTATGDVVVSLDDDSYPLAEDFFYRLPDLFSGHPEAAVISFRELREGGVFSSEEGLPGHYVPAYANCAAAMRREFYLEQPGFPAFFFHAYEEPDYALQCHAAGHAVWFEPSLVIRHHRSPVGRLPILQHHQNSRNELWSVWMRCPWPWVPLVRHFASGDSFSTPVLGVCHGYSGSPFGGSARYAAPVIVCVIAAPFRGLPTSHGCVCPEIRFSQFESNPILNSNLDLCDISRAPSCSRRGRHNWSIVEASVDLGRRCLCLRHGQRR